MDVVGAANRDSELNEDDSMQLKTLDTETMIDTCATNTLDAPKIEEVLNKPIDMNGNNSKQVEVSEMLNGVEHFNVKEVLDTRLENIKEELEDNETMEYINGTNDNETTPRSSCETYLKVDEQFENNNEIFRNEVGRYVEQLIGQALQQLSFTDGNDVILPKSCDKDDHDTKIDEACLNQRTENSELKDVDFTPDISSGDNIDLKEAERTSSMLDARLLLEKLLDFQLKQQNGTDIVTKRHGNLLNVSEGDKRPSQEDLDRFMTTSDADVMNARNRFMEIDVVDALDSTVSSPGPQIISSSDDEPVTPKKKSFFSRTGERIRRTLRRSKHAASEPAMVTSPAERLSTLDRMRASFRNRRRSSRHNGSPSDPQNTTLTHNMTDTGSLILEEMEIDAIEVDNREKKKKGFFAALVHRLRHRRRKDRNKSSKNHPVEATPSGLASPDSDTFNMASFSSDFTAESHRIVPPSTTFSVSGFSTTALLNSPGDTSFGSVHLDSIPFIDEVDGGRTADYDVSPLSDNFAQSKPVDVAALSSNIASDKIDRKQEAIEPAAITDKEALYAYIASQLASIGDDIHVKKSHSTYETLANKLSESANYAAFALVLSESFEDSNNKIGWDQIRSFFKISASAVSLIGRGTNKAQRLMDHVCCYFGERCSDWVVNEGGLQGLLNDPVLSSPQRKKKDSDVASSEQNGTLKQAADVPVDCAEID